MPLAARTGGCSVNSPRAGDASREHRPTQCHLSSWRNRRPRGGVWVGGTQRWAEHCRRLMVSENSQPQESGWKHPPNSNCGRCGKQRRWRPAQAQGGRGPGGWPVPVPVSPPMGAPDPGSVAFTDSRGQQQLGDLPGGAGQGSLEPRRGTWGRGGDGGPLGWRDTGPGALTV